MASSQAGDTILYLFVVFFLLTQKEKKDEN